MGSTVSQNDIPIQYLPNIIPSALHKDHKGFCEFPTQSRNRLHSFAGLLPLNDPPGQLPRVKLPQIIPKGFTIDISHSAFKYSWNREFVD